MQHEFWHQRWAAQQIGFHLESPNPLLLAHFPALLLIPGQRVLVPLCGKTVDIQWLLAQGMHVVGIELSQIAVEALFESLALTPAITQTDPFRHYHSQGLDIFQGDFFALDAERLGPVDAVYDRAALVALPPAMRAAYCRHLTALTQGAPQLLVSFDYDQSQLPGPPFCVNKEEVSTHYQADYTLQLVADEPLAGGLKGTCPAHEQVWLLSPR